MVGLALAPLKVPRRAVRILVVMVRSATARRIATPPRVASDSDHFPACTGAGRSSCLTGVESDCRSVTQLTGTRQWVPGEDPRLGRWLRPGDRCDLDTVKHEGGVGATCKIALSRGESFAPLAFVALRRIGTITATTWFLSGGRRKPPWSRTKLGEWSPRDEESFHNRPGGENLQSRTSDRKQVV